MNATHLESDLWLLEGDVSKEYTLLEEMEKAVREKKKAIRNLESEHSKKRLDLLLQKLEDRDLTWCNACGVTFSKTKAKMLFFEGVEVYSHGYEGGFTSKRDIRYLLRVGPECYDQSLGSSGPDSRGGHLFVRPAEKREEGYFAFKQGGWIKIDLEPLSIEEGLSRSSKLVKLFSDLQIPPPLKPRRNSIF